MKASFFLLLHVFLVLVSCSISTDEKIHEGDNLSKYDSVSPAQYEKAKIKEFLADENHKDRLISNVLSGDIKSYDTLVNYYMPSQREELFYYSYIAAYQYDNPKAYWIIYTIFTTNEYIDHPDPRIKDIAYYHLLKAYELKPNVFENNVKFILGDSIVPHSSYYLQKMSGDK